MKRWMILLLASLLMNRQVANGQATPETTRTQAARAAIEQEAARTLDREAADVPSQELQGVVQRSLARLFTGMLQPVVKDWSLAERDEAVAADGRLFVPLPLLRAVKYNDELAGVLAHALGHARLGPVPATGAALNYFPEYAPKNLMPLGFREASAKREMAADAEAVEILGRAGVNASGLLRYLERAKAAPERLRALRAKMEAIGVAANHLPETDECEIVQAWLNEQNAARPKPTLREPLRTSPRPPIN